MDCSDGDWLIIPDRGIFVEWDGGSGSAAVVGDSLVVGSATVSAINVSDIGATTGPGVGDSDSDALAILVDPAVSALGFVGSAGSVTSVGFVRSVGSVDSVGSVGSVDVDVDSGSNAIGPATSADTSVGVDAGSAGDVGDADKSSARSIVAVSGFEDGVAELDIEWDTGSAGGTVFPRTGSAFDALGDVGLCSGPMPHDCGCCGSGNCCGDVGPVF